MAENSVMQAFPVLTHWSPLAAKIFPYSEQQKAEQQPYMKPAGLWLSDEAGDPGWSQWCDAEEYPLGPLEHEVILRPDAGILWLQSEGDILEFTRQYGIKDRTPYCCDWHRVAAEYQGILITPYQRALRFDDRCHWYYNWDCASACIWDAEAIRSTRLVTKPARAVA